MRDAEAEGGEARRVYDACLMRRSGRKGLRKISLAVGIPYETLRRRLAGCNSRKEAVRYPDKRHVERGKYYALAVGRDELFGGAGELNKGKKGRPYKFGPAAIKSAAIFRAGTDMAWRPLEGLVRLQAGGLETPSYTQLRRRAAEIEIEAGDADGTPFLGICGAEYTIKYMVGDGSATRATTRGEYRQAVYGNCSYKRHSFAVMIDSLAKMALFMAVPGPGKGETGRMISGLVRGAMHRARSRPNVGLPDAVKCMYDGAADKAEAYAGAAGAGCELVAPVRIDSSSKVGPRRRRTPRKADAAAAPKDAAAPKPPDPPKIDGDMLRKKAIYDQNGGLDSVTPENRKKLDAMSDEEVRENRSEWRARNEFGLRVGVEGWFSAFKRTVGDEIKARTPRTMEQELLLKVGLYNT